MFVTDNFMQGPELLLKGATTYSAKVTDSAHGTIRSIEHTLQHLEELADTVARNIADGQKRLADTQVQVSSPFEYAGRLTALAQRQQEIADALDLTRNQAASQLESGPNEIPAAAD